MALVRPFAKNCISIEKMHIRVSVPAKHDSSLFSFLRRRTASKARRYGNVTEKQK